MTEEKARLLLSIYQRGWVDLSSFARAVRTTQSLKLLKREHIEGAWFAFEVGHKLP